MNNDPSLSIQGASVLMGTPSNPDGYLILKIAPDPRGCCCIDCWPEAWRAVNRHIAPAGPIGHEGNVLLGGKDGRFVLEGHESGPEIVVYVTASILLVKAVLELITTILKNVTQDRKGPSRIKLVRRFAREGRFEEEVILKLDLPLSEESAKKLKLQVRKALTAHRTPRTLRRVPRRK